MTKKILVKSDYSAILKEIKSIISKARYNAFTAINIEMLKAYFEIGRKIVEEEQKGEKRAGYGQNLLEIISKETEVAIIRLKGLGATDEMIETMLKKGATPKDVYNAIKRTDDIDVVWLDEQKSWGHVVENEHNIQIQNALGLPNMENAVKDKILDAAKNGEKSIDDPYLIINNYQNPITSNWYELRVVLWETSNSAIKTAYPRRI